jgi:hypothetical protein
MKLLFLVLTFTLFISCSSSKCKKKTQVEADKSLGVCVSGNCKNGSGTFEYKNGDRYIGQFVNSKPEGKGIYINSKKESISGEFKDGKPHGFASQYDANRNLIYSGQWVNGEKKD